MSELPPGWHNSRVGDLIEIGPRTDCSDETVVGFVPLHRLGVTFRSRHTFEPRRWAEVRKGYTHFANGDVLLARITPSFENGKAGIARDLPNGLGAGSTEYFVCRPRAQALLPDYLLAHFKTRQFLHDGQQVMSGAVGQQRVPKQYVLDSMLPLPPLPEQKRIAVKLNALLERVDASATRIDRVPGILKRFRQSVLAAATSGALTREWREERGLQASERTIAFDDDALIVPTHWKVAELSTLLDAERPLCYGVVQPGQEAPSGPLLVRVQDLSGGTIVLPALRTISADIDREYQRSRVRGGDVLISVVGTIGRLAVVPEEFAGNIARAIARLACGQLVLPHWLRYWLENHVVQRWLLRNSREVARKTLNLSELATTRVAVPPIDEQAEIVRRTGELLAVADQIEARCRRVSEMVDNATPAILAKAFRGELVPQDPNDEPASQLLRRLGAEHTSPKPRPNLRAARSKAKQEALIAMTKKLLAAR